MEKVGRSRRRFIKAVVFVIASVSLVWKFLIPRVSRKKPLLRVAKAEVPPGGALVFRKSRDGEVFKGPADRPLKQLAVEERGEFIVVLG
jgi:hypothetical protein